MNETLYPLEDLMHAALPPSDLYPFTPAKLAPADEVCWYVPSGEFIHVMDIKNGQAEPGLRAAPSRDVVKSTLLMARNDLPIGSGYVPAFDVLKLMTLLGRAVGEEEVFKQVFSAYLQRFRSPVKLMPNWRTIHQTAGAFPCGPMVRHGGPSTRLLRAARRQGDDDLHGDCRRPRPSRVHPPHHRRGAAALGMHPL